MKKVAEKRYWANKMLDVVCLEDFKMTHRWFVLNGWNGSSFCNAFEVDEDENDNIIYTDYNIDLLTIK